MKKVLETVAEVGAAILQWVDTTYRKVVPNKGYLRFWVWCAIAFVAALCWVNVDSYWADKNSLNGLLTTIGIILTLFVIILFAVGALEYRKDKHNLN